MKKRLFILVIVTVLLSTVLTPFTAYAVTEEELQQQIAEKDNAMKKLRASIETLNAELKDAKAESAALKSDIDNLKKDIAELNKLIEPAEEKITELQATITVLEGKISEYNGKKTELEQQISDCEDAINNAEGTYNDKREMLKMIMRTAYENGFHESVSGISILLDANSLSDYVEKMEAVDKIVDATKSSMSEYLNAINDKTKYKETLEASKSELSVLLDSLEADTKSYNETLATVESERDKLEDNKNSLLKSQNELNKKLSDSQDLEDSINDKLATQKAQLTKYQKEMAQLEKELEDIQSVNTTGAEKYFLWPLSKKYTITSYYDDPEYYEVFGVHHYAIDVGGYKISGTPIYATKSGTVTKSAYQAGGAGNYVILDHGNGELSYYYHMTERSVKKGDTVKQGQTIGTVGSTGNSTGPHLHFAIKINGKWVDPLPLVKDSRPSK